VTRYLAGPDVGRESEGADVLRRAFTVQVGRKQRRSDGTLSLDGVRFDVPNRYRHLDRLTVRYARWDLSVAWLFDKRTDVMLCTIYPLDKERHGDGCRRSLEPLDDSLPEPESRVRPGIAPLLKRLMANHAATGLPPAYLPQRESTDEEDNDG